MRCNALTGVLLSACCVNAAYNTDGISVGFDLKESYGTAAVSYPDGKYSSSRFADKLVQLASAVATAVGDGTNSSWLLASLTMAFVVFAPPVSQAADYWGRRWLLIVLALIGCAGTLITSRATSVGNLPSSRQGQLMWILTLTSNYSWAWQLRARC